MQELLPKFKFLKVEFLYVQLQFMYHVFVVALVVLTHEHVELVHIGIPPWPIWSSVILRSLSSTQQLYDVPFFVHVLLVKLRFLKVEFLCVQLQFQYHDLVAVFVVLTQEQLTLLQSGPLFGP